MTAIEPVPAPPAGSARDIDYEAAAKRAWAAFTRKPIELIVGVLIATITAFVVVTVGAVALGVNHQALEAVRGRDVTIGTALAGYSRFGSSFVAALLVLLAVLIGTALCVIPGILAAFFFYWTFLCMADDPRLGAGDAMRRSFTLVKAHPLPTLVVILANLVLSLAGSMIVVGFLVTSPLGLLFGAAVFDQLRASDHAPVVVTPAPSSPTAGT